MHFKSEIFSQKHTLREDICRKRKALAPKVSGQAFLAQFQKLNWEKYQVFASYAPLASEADVSMINEYLLLQGKTLALPVVEADNKPLVFRQMQAKEELTKGRFGILIAKGKIVTPEVILIPLVAFDKSGNRLGMGGGFYDRTLEVLPDSLRIGVAFSVQEVAHIPTGTHDKKLHLIITEKEIISVSEIS